MFSKETLHHAYFIEGDKAAILAAVEAFLEDAFSIKREGHPDVHFSEYESMGIDESRSLQEMQSMRPLLGDRKIFIIIVQSMTGEAQNSLLKVFEEPTPGTHFFVISPSQRILLPTLRSRMIVLVHESTNETSDGGAREFTQLSYKDRFTFVADMIEAKDRSKAEGLLQGIVSILDEDKESLDKSKGELLKELLTLIRYVKDRSSSLKLILERVSLMDLS
jgi:DNA polymerase III delta prime subunit